MTPWTATATHRPALRQLTLARSNCGCGLYQTTDAVSATAPVVGSSAPAEVLAANGGPPGGYPDEVFVPAEELAAMFTDVVAMFRDHVAPWFAMQGHRRAVLLLAEHPTRHVFWLVAPEGEGRFLSIMPWTESGDALIDDGQSGRPDSCSQRRQQ